MDFFAYGDQFQLLTQIRIGRTKIVIIRLFYTSFFDQRGVKRTQVVEIISERREFESYK